jgi:glycosyltransferase involved in cell wall biosynthesis
MSTLLWTCPNRTPYNDYFFNSLAKNLPHKFAVIYFNEHIETHPWKALNRPSYRSKVVPASLRNATGLLKELIQSKADAVVIAGWNYPGVMLLWLGCMLTRTPYAIWNDTPHSEDRPFFIRQIRRVYLFCLLRAATRVWGTGAEALVRLKALGATSKSLQDLPYFVDIDELKRPTSQPNSQSNGPVRIISCGRLDNNQKCYDQAIQAIGLLRERGIRNIHYMIIGDGKDRVTLEGLIAKMALDHTVIITGWMEHNDITRYLTEADIFLHPSAFDPFAVAIIEAMAAGLIVVGSIDAMSAYNRIRHGQNGLILYKRTPQAIADALEQLLNTRNRWPDMRAAARQTTEEWPVSRGTKIVSDFMSD